MRVISAMTFLFRLDACVSWWGNEGFSHSMCPFVSTRTSYISSFLLCPSWQYWPQTSLHAMCYFQRLFIFSLNWVLLLVCWTGKNGMGGWWVCWLPQEACTYLCVCVPSRKHAHTHSYRSLCTIIWVHNIKSDTLLANCHHVDTRHSRLVLTLLS